MIKKSFNSLLSSTPLPILVLTAFVCLIILPSDVICSTKMYKEKSCTVVHYFAGTENFQQLILWRRKKKEEISNRIIVFISSARIDSWRRFIFSKPPERLHTATSKAAPFTNGLLTGTKRKMYFCFSEIITYLVIKTKPSE